MAVEIAAYAAEKRIYDRQRAQTAIAYIKARKTKHFIADIFQDDNLIV